MEAAAPDKTDGEKWRVKCAPLEVPCVSEVNESLSHQLTGDKPFSASLS